MRARGRPSRKRGSALLIALGMLALAAALLAGSAQAGRAAGRAAQSQAASVTADAEARRALANFLGEWSASADSIPVGQGRDAVVAPRPVGATGLIASSRLRLLRVSERRYVIGLEVTVGPMGVVAARRRLSLILERGSGSDTSSARSALRPIGRWSLSDTF